MAVGDEDDTGGEVEVHEDEDEKNEGEVVAWLVVVDVTTAEGGVILCRPIARQLLGASFRERDLSRFSEAESEEVILNVMVIFDDCDDDELIIRLKRLR